MSIGRQNVGIKLAITPHINQADHVRLEVQVEVSEVASESDLGPIIGQRVAKTSCVVGDHRTVVLGGLITEDEIQAVQKVPVLGDIPIIGRLFERTSVRTTKRNLVILLTPTIIRDVRDFRRLFARKMQERRDFIDRYTAFEYHEVQPDLDYARTNGLLEEMRQSIDDLDEERQRVELLQLEGSPEHVPRSPLAPMSRARDGEGRR
jgi:general secretion pathway protein D